jgi:hypothetical protein
VFKIAANIDRWETLYLSPTASDAVKSFLPPEPPRDDRPVVIQRKGDIVVDRLILVPQDSRPRMILLIYDDARGFEVGTRLLIAIGDTIRRLAAAPDLGSAGAERLILEEACRSIHDGIFGTFGRSALTGAETRQRPERPGRTSPLLAVIAIVLALGAVLVGHHALVPRLSSIEERTKTAEGDIVSLKARLDAGTEDQSAARVARITDVLNGANKDIDTVWDAWNNERWSDLPKRALAPEKRTLDK